MSDGIDISKKDKAEVLAALYNASKPQGMGFIHFTPEDMEASEASQLLDETTSFDYLKGRVMKVNLSRDTFMPFAYDRDNGEGAAARAIESVEDKA